MAERRSGVDLIACCGGWAVVYDGRLLSLHPGRGEAVAAARGESRRVLLERELSGRARPLMPRLAPDRRKPKHVNREKNINMPSTPPTVLVVSDGRTHRFFAQALAQIPVQVQHIENGENAFDIVLETQPAVVVNDLCAEHTDGMELREELRRDDRTRHIPVLTVHGSADTWVRAMRIVTLLLTVPPERRLAALRRFIASSRPPVAAHH